ncbi:hypothetical protein AM371_07755 [Serratia marcescens]|nr:hypothetical protein AM371_07755 [Serratia marcescens]
MHCFPPFRPYRARPGSHHATASKAVHKAGRRGGDSIARNIYISIIDGQTSIPHDLSFLRH